METSTSPIKSHIGKKISRIRELRGWSEVIEDEALERIAKVLGVSTDAIKHFNDEAIFNIMGNTYHDHSASLNYQCSFNPIDKIVELYNEKVQLLERLLQSEKEKVEMLKGQKNFS